MLRGWTTAPVHQGKRARSFVWIPLHLASTEWQGGIGHVKTLKSKVKLQRVERREETTWLGTSKGAQETVSAASSAMDRGWELWHPLETDKPSILGPQSDSERKRDSPFRIPTPTTPRSTAWPAASSRCLPMKVRFLHRPGVYATRSWLRTELTGTGLGRDG